MNCHDIALYVHTNTEIYEKCISIIIKSTMMDLCDNPYCQLFGCFKTTSQLKQDFEQNILYSGHTSTHSSIGIRSHFLMCPDFGMGRCHRSDGQIVKSGNLGSKDRQYFGVLPIFTYL